MNAETTINVATQPPATSPPAPTPATSPATSLPPSDWQSYHRGYSGLIGLAERFRNVDAFTHEAPNTDHPAALHVVSVHVFKTRADAMPIVARGKAKFDEHMQDVRQKIHASEEHKAWHATTNEIGTIDVKSSELKTKIDAADATLDEIAKSATDEEYQAAASSTRDRKDRLARLGEQRIELAGKLPQLEADLSSRCRSIVVAKAAEAQAAIATELEDLCGILRGNENALDRLLELDTLRGLVRWSISGPQVSQQLVAEIVAPFHQAHPDAAPIPDLTEMLAGRINARVAG